MIYLFYFFCSSAEMTLYNFIRNLAENQAMNGAAKYLYRFVNRNPRNMERMRLQRKPDGWTFERNQSHNNFIYRFASLNTCMGSGHSRRKAEILKSNLQFDPKLNLYQELSQLEN